MWLYFRSVLLLFLLCFHFLLMRFDDRLRHVGWDHIVVVEFHREVTASTCDRAELGGIARHFAHGDVRHDGSAAMFRLSALYASAAGVEVAHYIAHVRIRDGHTHVHDRLKQN